VDPEAARRLCHLLSADGAGQNASLGGSCLSRVQPVNCRHLNGGVDSNSDSVISSFIGPAPTCIRISEPTRTTGIPFVIVDGNQKPGGVNLGAYGGESDPGPMPIPANALVEGGSSSTGDRHFCLE